MNKFAVFAITVSLSGAPAWGVRADEPGTPSVAGPNMPVVAAPNMPGVVRYLNRRGFLIPSTAQTLAQRAAAPPPEEPTDYSGIIKLFLDMSVISQDIPKDAKFDCSVFIFVSGYDLTTGLGDDITTQVFGEGVHTGNKAICKFVIPYLWKLKVPKKDMMWAVGFEATFTDEGYPRTIYTPYSAPISVPTNNSITNLIWNTIF